MKRATGFTLLQLLVVVFSLVVVATLVITISHPARMRAQCAGNVNSVYKGVMLYMQCGEAQFPMLPGNNWDSTPDGTNYLPSGLPGTKPPYKPNGDADWTSPRSVTSLMFMLVRDGQNPGIFVCPADKGATPDPAPQTSVSIGGARIMAWNWDFSSGQDGGGKIGSKRNVSYSWQCPIYRGDGSEDGNGIMNPDQGLAIMSDRVPGKFGDMNYMSGWNPAASNDDSQRRRFNSQNHSGGKCMNVLDAGGNVAPVKTPNCGLDLGSSGLKDCIFTAKDNSGDKAPSLHDTGAAFGGAQDNKRHKGKEDSYLAGGRDSQ